METSVNANALLPIHGMGVPFLRSALSSDFVVGVNSGLGVNAEGKCSVRSGESEEPRERGPAVPRHPSAERFHTAAVRTFQTAWQTRKKEASCQDAVSAALPAGRRIER